MTEQQYLAIRNRVRSVVKGPWFWKYCYECDDGERRWALVTPETIAHHRILNPKLVLMEPHEDYLGQPFLDEDLQFLAHAREDIDILLEEVEQLWASVPVRHLDIGQGSRVAVLQIVAILPFEGRAMKRLRDDAYADGRLVDACKGLAAQSMIITKSNHVILSPIAIDDLLAREEHVKEEIKTG